jgi:hypothetical protein
MDFDFQQVIFNMPSDDWHSLSSLVINKNKSTAHGCWTLDFFVSDIKLQAIYKVIHTSNMIGNEMKLNIPVHYQMGNPLQQGRWPCHLHIQSYLPLFRHST